MSPDEGRAAFAAHTDVSRETLQRFDIYYALLEKWNRRINLIGRKTMTTAWRRHFLDSAQLISHIPADVRTIVDLGSGAGFPGLVMAILRHDLNFHLVDSDQRKCVFLREVARQTGVNVEIHANRIERLTDLAPDLIVARALAPIADLLVLSQHIAAADTRYLFLKGQDVDVELTKAAKCWIIEPQKTPSIVDPQGTILALNSAKPILDEPNNEATDEDSEI
jgi:16S rRNA (guanine527-N7)-methyltransferase